MGQGPVEPVSDGAAVADPPLGAPPHGADPVIVCAGSDSKPGARVGLRSSGLSGKGATYSHTGVSIPIPIGLQILCLAAAWSALRRVSH